MHAQTWPSHEPRTASTHKTQGATPKPPNIQGEHTNTRSKATVICIRLVFQYETRSNRACGRSPNTQDHHCAAPAHCKVSNIACGRDRAGQGAGYAQTSGSEMRGAWGSRGGMRGRWVADDASLTWRRACGRRWGVLSLPTRRPNEPTAGAVVFKTPFLVRNTDGEGLIRKGLCAPPLVPPTQARRHRHT